MRRLYLAIAVILLCTFAFAAKKAQLGFEKPKFKKVPGEIMSRLENAGDAFDYPNANVIIIETVDSTIYKENGSAISYFYTISKPITSQGLKDEGTHEFAYDSQLMSVDITYAAVIHPDSTIEFVSDTAIVDELASTGMEDMDIYYTTYRRKKIHFPQLYSGDVVVLSGKYELIRPFFEGVLEGNSSFQSTEPIHVNRSVALVPKSIAKNIKHKIFNDKDQIVKFREYDAGKYHVFVWEADSVPGLIFETGMPPANLFIPLVLFSNVSWREASKAAWELTEPPMIIHDPELVATVKALVETCKTEFDSIRAIITFVSQEIRYIGLSIGEKAGVTPHPVDETFRAEAGVCKDKSALAVAMLRQAGIEAYNVYTDPEGHKHYDIASLMFPHQIIMAKMKNGKEIFADVTDDVCKDLLPGVYSKKPYLVITPNGEDLKYFPIIPADKNLGTIEAQTRIDSLGNLTSTVTITGDGIYDEVLRQIGQFFEKEDRKKLFERLIAEIDPNAILEEITLEPEPPKNLSIPAKLTVKYRIPEFAVMAGDYLLLSVPQATHVFDILSGTLGEYTKLEKRTFPLYFGYTFGANVTETIELDKEYLPKSLPNPMNIQDKYFVYNMQYNLSGKILTFRYSIRLQDIDIPLEQYQTFRENIVKYSNSSKGMTILVKETKEEPKKKGTKKK